MTNPTTTPATPQLTAELILHKSPEGHEMSIFNKPEQFEYSLRIAKMLSSSDIVPEAYKGRVDNVMVALEISNRMQVSPLMVMQNMDIIHGKPGFNSKFCAAMVNGCGKYSALRYKYAGEGDKRSCMAYARELSTGDTLEGPPCSVSMAKTEGWWNKKGSKWPTMTELMLSYRAATFWTRVFEPGLTMGIPTSEEVQDVNGYETANPGSGKSAKFEKFNESIPSPQVNDHITDAVEVVDVAPVANEDLI